MFLVYFFFILVLVSIFCQQEEDCPGYCRSHLIKCPRFALPSEDHCVRLCERLPVSDTVNNNTLSCRIHHLNKVAQGGLNQTEPNVVASCQAASLLGGGTCGESDGVVYCGLLRSSPTCSTSALWGDVQCEKHARELPLRVRATASELTAALMNGSAVQHPTLPDAKIPLHIDTLRCRLETLGRLDNDARRQAGFDSLDYPGCVCPQLRLVCTDGNCQCATSRCNNLGCASDDEECESADLRRSEQLCQVVRETAMGHGYRVCAFKPQKASASNSQCMDSTVLYVVFGLLGGFALLTVLFCSCGCARPLAARTFVLHCWVAASSVLLAAAELSFDLVTGGVTIPFAVATATIMATLISSMVCIVRPVLGVTDEQSYEMSSDSSTGNAQSGKRETIERPLQAIASLLGVGVGVFAAVQMGLIGFSFLRVGLIAEAIGELALLVVGGLNECRLTVGSLTGRRGHRGPLVTVVVWAVCTALTLFASVFLGLAERHLNFQCSSPSSFYRLGNGLSDNWFSYLS